MKIIELDLKLPDIFYEIEEKVKKVKVYGDYTIGGGSISNIYMKEKVRDIDVFCAFDLSRVRVEEEFGEIIETKAFHGYSEGDIPYLFKVSYKGYDIELIRTFDQKPLEFDLRFRQFYLKNGKVFANEKALEDIKNKEIVVVNPATPMQTFIRVERFKEQFGFTVSKKSEDYLLWGFNQQNIKTDWAYEFLDKQKEKLSEKTFNYTLSWIKAHTVKPGKEKLIKVKNAAFPFHPAIEKVIKENIPKSVKSLSLNYEIIESFKEDKRKVLSLSLPFTHYEGKIKKLIEKVKTMRLRYVLSEYQKEAPMPQIKKEEVPKRFREYLNPDFIKNFVFFLKAKKEKWDSDIHYLWDTIRPISDNPKIELKWNEWGALSDLLTQNELIMIIDDTLPFKLRLCDNGKYTISGFLNLEPDGCGFYVDIIGRALKEQHGDWFDFDNKELKGKYRYDYPSRVADYYFEPYPYVFDLFKERKLDFLQPILLPDKEKA